MLTELEKIEKAITIFKASMTEIRPHFILTGPSGAGKSRTIKYLADKLDLGYCEINGAALTKEGTSGNSVSKAMAKLSNMPAHRPTIVFVDEFDKLFISGNHNSDLAHETTNGVQNEFLKVLESDTASIFSNFGKYQDIPVDHCLFIFAGAFNGEEDIDIDRLRELGVKTEFLGRVGLTFAIQKPTLEELIDVAVNSTLTQTYLDVFDDVKKEDINKYLTESLTEAYENNTLGYRLITTLTHQYFISGGKPDEKSQKKVVFKEKLSL